MVSVQEIDLLAVIVQRAPILRTELMFVNDVMNRLRTMCQLAQVEAATVPEDAFDKK